MNPARSALPTKNLRAQLLGFLRLFSIRGRWIFPLLVCGLAMLSVGAWWSVKSAIESDLSSRAESEADRIESTIRSRLGTIANTLVFMRGDFAVTGQLSPDRFHSFVAALDVQHRFAGTRAFGFAPLEPGATEAPITLLEPQDLRTQPYLHTDALRDDRVRQALLESAETGEPVLTGPLQNLSEKTSFSEQRFLVVLALTDLPPTDTARGLRDVRGILFAAIRSNEFFEGIFGAPSLNKESVNFSLESGSHGRPGPSFYNRFDLTETKADSSVRLARETKLLGRDVTLRVTPLPHFFKASDHYLPLLVGFGAAFISILILLVLKTSQNQLIYETQAKEVSWRAAQRSRSQSELLNRLNVFSREVSEDLDLETILSRLADLAPKLIHADRSFFYCAREDGPSAKVRLVGHSGVELASLRHRTLTVQEAHSILPNRFLMLKKDRDAAFAFKELLTIPDQLADWILLGIPSRETGRCGLIFLGRVEGPHFDDLEIEVIESFVSQAAGGMENARLFRKVEQASHAKNAFLANMSHEIRTPLNAIIGFSEILLKDPTNAQKATLAHNIRRGSHQLTRIIDDILDLSKIESGGLLTEQKRVRLLPILQEVRAVMELRALEKRVQFSIESSGPLPSHIHTDEVRLKQVLSILLGNAIKFTEKGSVSMTVRCHTEESGESLLVFRVKDTGVGIAAESQQRLFEPFSQADDSKTRRFGGSGMGLALSRRLCQELGGGLHLVESSTGQGTVFEARIGTGALKDVTWSENLFQTAPIDEPLSAQPPNHTVHNGRLRGARILLVEDSVDNQEIFCFFLEAAGAHIEVVENGLDAVSRAASKPFEMILMDIQIPEIDGKEATRRIRKQGFSRPIVALTAHALLEERVSCIEAGCDGQITKPVSGENLVNEVAEYLRRTNGSLPQHLERNESALSGAAQI